MMEILKPDITVTLTASGFSKSSVVAVESVQNGTTSLSGTTTEREVSINKVNLSRSIILESTRSSTSPIPSLRAMFTGAKFLDSETIEFTRAGGNSDAGSTNIQWQVVEFNQPISVQSGSFSFGGLEESISISPVDWSKAMIVSNYSVTTSTEAAIFVRTLIVSDDEILFHRTSSTGIVFMNYFIVEFE